MKKTGFIVFTIFIFLIASCSNGKIVETQTETSDTIKFLVKQKEQNKNWTRELEENKLIEPLNNEFIVRNYSISNEAFKSTYVNYEPVYPEIKDFGSLDTSLLNDKTLNSVKGFCNLIKENYSHKASDYFNEKYLFNAVFFFNNLEENWSKTYGDKFPEYNDEKTAVLFDGFYIGKPDFSQNENFVNIPVLFYSKNKKLYVKILVNPEEEKMIYQVYINRWE